MSDMSSDVCSSDLPLHADALHPGVRREIGRPFPGGDREVDFRILRRNAHHLGPAPDDRADIPFGDALRRDHLVAGGVALRHRPGTPEIPRHRARKTGMWGTNVTVR